MIDILPAEYVFVVEHSELYSNARKSLASETASSEAFMTLTQELLSFTLCINVTYI